MCTNRPLLSVESTSLRAHVRMTTDGFWLPLPLIVGDLAFQAQRRAWSQAASRAGVTNFGYLFAQPQPASATPGLGGKMRCSHLSLLVSQPRSRELFLQVYHGSEVPFVYGAPPNASATATSLSGAMLDYWISFATSLNPNDGHGNTRIISNLLFHSQNLIARVVVRSHMDTIHHGKSSEIVVDCIYWHDF